MRGVSDIPELLLISLPLESELSFLVFHLPNLSGMFVTACGMVKAEENRFKLGRDIPLVLVFVLII
jgi:hypothetical protein